MKKSRTITMIIIVLLLTALLMKCSEVDRLSASVTALNIDVAAKQKAIDSYERWAAEYATLDAAHTRRTQEAQREMDQLRAAIRDGERRLSIRATCPPRLPDTADAPRVGDGKDRADIDPGAAERIVALTERGDKAIRQLTACQDYVLSMRGMTRATYWY